MIGDRSFCCFALLPAPRRMTWGGLWGNESRHCRTAASIIRSNQSVRTASMTPAVPRGPPSRLSGIIIFSQRRRREASPANIPAKWSWITCAHNARPAAVCRAVRSRASSSRSSISCTRLIFSVYKRQTASTCSLMLTLTATDGDGVIINGSDRGQQYSAGLVRSEDAV